VKTLRIGLVGAGHIAASHLAAWREAPGCELAGILDVRREAAAARASQFGVERVHGEIDSLVTDCDVVDVCTPPATHAELARTAIAAGRHLLCEKPLVTSLDEWEELADLLEGSDSRIAVVHNLKYVRAVRRARRWLEDGRLGRLLRLSRLFLTDPAGDRMLAGPHWSHELPGGRWFETLPHALYLIHSFLGPLEPAGVTALHTAGAPPGAPADEVTVLFRGATGLADVHYSANCRLNRRLLTLWGTHGRVTIDLLADSARLSRRGDSRLRRAGGGLGETLVTAARWPLDRAGYLGSRLPSRRPHALLIREFARYLHGDGPSPTPLAEIDYVVRTAQRIGAEIDRQVARSHDASG
jgi:predicted dehydrogenase